MILLMLLFRRGNPWCSSSPVYLKVVTGTRWVKAVVPVWRFMSFFCMMLVCPHAAGHRWGEWFAMLLIYMKGICREDFVTQNWCNHLSFPLISPRCIFPMRVSCMLTVNNFLLNLINMTFFFPPVLIHRWYNLTSESLDN